MTQSIAGVHIGVMTVHTYRIFKKVHVRRENNFEVRHEQNRSSRDKAEAVREGFVNHVTDQDIRNSQTSIGYRGVIFKKERRPGSTIGSSGGFGKLSNDKAQKANFPNF